MVVAKEKYCLWILFQGCKCPMKQLRRSLGTVKRINLSGFHLIIKREKRINWGKRINFCIEKKIISQDMKKKNRFRWRKLRKYWFKRSSLKAFLRERTLKTARGHQMRQPPLRGENSSYLFILRSMKLPSGCTGWRESVKLGRFVRILSKFYSIQKIPSKIESSCLGSHRRLRTSPCPRTYPRRPSSSLPQDST